jgi:hypothetical protein
VISNLSDAVVISFPKCGRTWLRVLLGELFKTQFNLKSEELIEIHRFTDENSKVPRVYFSHDDNPHKKEPKDLVRNKDAYKKQKIIFLIRDPRDILVSIYHHKRFRSNDFEGSISDYCNQKVGGLESIIDFFNIWQDNRKIIPNFLIIRYENLHDKPVEEIRKILDFLNVADVSKTTIKEAIDFASFGNMRKIELSGSANNDKLVTNNPKNETTFKTRSGKVGGYKQHFTDIELEKIETLISESLSNEYHYYK